MSTGKIKIRLLPETNSSSSHALVLPPHISENTIYGIELVNYFVSFIDEVFEDENITKDFVKLIKNHPRIKQELEKYPQYKIKTDFIFGIDSYSIPKYKVFIGPQTDDFVDIDEETIKNAIFRLYSTVLAEAIENNWGVELVRESVTEQTAVPWYSALISESIIRIYRPGNYYLYITEGHDQNLNIYSRIKILDHGETNFIPEVPESIDLKITNKCYAMCPFCHENSTPDGEHAEWDTIEAFIEAVRTTPVPEVTIGGGNPLLHPNINEIINELSRISAVSITARDLDYLEYGLPDKVTGYGISLTNPKNLAKLFETYEFHKYPVIHVINGVHKTRDVAAAIRTYIESGPNRYLPAVLILGFKNFGRGANWKIKNTIDIDFLMQKYPNTVYSFDDLAIKQLGIQNKLPKRNWDLFYNGEDGKFTMYIDLVKEQYARNSYSAERHRIEEWDIRKMFDKVRVK